VLFKLRKRSLSIKLEKYEFYKYSVAFLGYIILDKRLIIDSAKTKSMQD